MAEKLMYFPTWVDLKGQDSVPDTVHHVIVPVDPRQVSKYRVFEKEGHAESGSKLINFLPEIPRGKNFILKCADLNRYTFSSILSNEKVYLFKSAHFNMFVIDV